MLYKRYLHTPLGALILLSSERSLELVSFLDDDKIKSYKSIPLSSNGILDKVSKYLQQYFCGQKPKLPKVTMNIQTSNFSQKVYHFLRFHCNYGHTITYKDLAFCINHPKAFRSVGSACKKNRFVILIPCHRVIAVNGQVNYAGGKDRKVALLALEKRYSVSK